MTKPDALRLADELEKDRWHITAVTAHEASEELRRLHGVLQAKEDECETHSAAVYEATRLLAEAREQRDALLEALKVVFDDLMHKDHARVIDVARAAIAKSEEA